MSFSKVCLGITFIGIILLFNATNISAQPGGEGVVIGKAYSLTSNIFNEKRTILVYLPDHYQTTQTRYPVLYVLDGYDHFHYVSGMVLSLSRAGKIPKMIVVGIQNPNRNRDFTPNPVEGLPNSGGGNKFLQFAEDELFPFIENNLRTEPCRVLIGHSLCGMFSIYTLFKNPEMFKGIIAVSPAAAIDNSFLLKYAKTNMEDDPDLNNLLYFTVGGKEKNEHGDSIFELKKIFETYPVDELHWGFEQLEGEDHHTVVHMSIYNGLTYIFSSMFPTDELLSGDADSIIEHYEDASEKYGYNIIPAENMLNVAGYKHLNDEDYYDAIDAFKVNVELYPNSPNAYNSLGEAYELNNQFDLAFEYYKAAYDIGSKTRDQNLYYFIEDYERMKKKTGKR